MNKKKLYIIRNEPSEIKVPRFEEKNGFYTTPKSSSVMSKIKGKNTKPEIILRKAIWALGYRYRLNMKILGKPDITFVQKRLLIFIDGDFWHGFNWEDRKNTIKVNRAYWVLKIERNMQRDKQITSALSDQGWIVIRFWEHQIKKDLDGCISKIITLINN